MLNTVIGVVIILFVVLALVGRYIRVLKDITSYYMYPVVRSQVKRVLIETGDGNADEEYIDASETLEAATQFALKLRVSQISIKDMRTIKKAHDLDMIDELEKEFQLWAMKESEMFSLDVYMWFLSNNKNIDKFLEELGNIYRREQLS